MRWLLGIDAGGTRTRAELLATEGRERRGSVAGPCNLTTLSRQGCLAAVDAAWAGLGDDVRAGEVAAVCLCSAGFYPPRHRDDVLQEMRRRWPAAALRAEPDLLAAWAGALNGEAGVVVVAGTGSVCYGRSAAGAEARAGGWGPLFDDEGSGYWLACRALGRVAMWVDGRATAADLATALRGRPTPIEEAGPWLRELLEQRPTREQIASFAPAVVEAATAGDAAAIEILDAAAAELARMAAAVAAQLGGAAGLPWSWSGGLLTGCVRLREGIQSRLDAAGSGLRGVSPSGPPSWGALVLAGQLIGHRCGVTDGP